MNREPSHGSKLIRAAGFTLIELLVVVTSVSLLAALLAPVLGWVKERAQTGISDWPSLNQSSLA